MKFSIKDFFNKCDQIRRKMRIWSHLLEKSLTENFIFCVLLAPSIFKSTLGTFQYENSVLLRMDKI